jgi:hypothetical protein
MNVFVLIYFIANRGLVTDFSEPPNLFAISINSPPNQLMAGACGGGPEGKQYSIKFGVEIEGAHLYITDKGEGLYEAKGQHPFTESVFSFRDLVRRGGKGGRWNKLPEETNIEMGASTAYAGGGTQERRRSTEDLVTPNTPNSKSLKNRLNLSKTFSVLARKRNAL